MDKNDLRKELRLKRDMLSKDLIVKLSSLLYNRIINDERFIKAKTIMTYVSMGSEADTHNLINYSLKMGKKVSVPVVVRGTKTLEISYINSMDDLLLGSYEILEPKQFARCNKEDIDLIIVPAIAFDLNGHRIGYGAGFYDRLLAENTNAVKMGIGYDFSIVENTFPQKYDVSMDCILTDERTIEV